MANTELKTFIIADNSLLLDNSQVKIYSYFVRFIVEDTMRERISLSPYAVKVLIPLTHTNLMFAPGAISDNRLKANIAQ